MRRVHAGERVGDPQATAREQVVLHNSWDARTDERAIHAHGAREARFRSIIASSIDHNLG